MSQPSLLTHGEWGGEQSPQLQTLFDNNSTSTVRMIGPGDEQHDDVLGPLLLTWFTFNPSMDK